MDKDIAHLEANTTSSPGDTGEKLEGSTHLDRLPTNISVTVDDARKVLVAHAQDAPITPEEIRRVRRRIDFVCIPLMWFVYVVNYTDKSIFSLGANFGMVQDLGLFVHVPGGKTDTSRYSNATTIYYIGFIAGAPIFALLAQRFPTAKVCSIAVILWGMVCASTAGCHNYPGAMVQRTFLGLTEAGVLPCFVLLTGMWYTKHEQALRIALWYAGGGSSLLISTPINYGILHANGSSYAPWRLMFIFWGALTIVFGFFLFWFLPDNPTSARMRSEREKYVAVERLRMNQTGIVNHKFKPKQALEAIKDIKLIMLGLIVFAISTANGVTSSFNYILFHNLLKASPYRSMVLSIPSGMVNVVFTLAAGYITSKFRNVQTIVAVTIEGLVLLGCILLWVLPQDKQAGLFAGIYLITTYLGAVVCIYGFTTANIAGHTKKTIAAAWLVVNVNAANAAVPQFFKSDEAPGYVSGFIAVSICQIGAISMTCFYTFLNWRENKRRDAMGDVAKVDRAFQDLTDKENLSFRYIL